MADNSLFSKLFNVNSGSHTSASGNTYGGGGYSRPATSTIPNSASTSQSIYASGSNPYSGPAYTNGANENVNYNHTATSGGSSSGNKGGGSSSSSSASVSGTADMSGYLTELANQRRAAAQNAYNQGMAKLGEIYGRQYDTYGNIYNSGLDQLNNSYNNSMGKIDKNAENALKEAYVNRMLSEKNLSQKMAAQGLSGGASESSMAGLINNYGNARNNIQDTWDTNRADLEMTRNNNLASLYDAYQQNLAQLEANRGNAELSLLNNLNNQIMSVDDSLFDALAKNPASLTTAIKNSASDMGSYVPKETTVTNPVDKISIEQSNDMGDATQGGRLKALEDLYKDQLRQRISADPSLNYGQATNWLAGLNPGNLNAQAMANAINYYNNLGYKM